MQTTVLYYLLYVAGFFLTASSLAQAYLNYRLKSTQGLSAWMMYFSTITATIYTLFVYHFPHPYSHRIASFMTQAAAYVLVFQQFYYADPYFKVRWWRTVYLFTGLGIAGIYLPFWWYDVLPLLGHMWGWLVFVLAALVQLPQLYYNWERKTMHGFSLGFVILQLIGIFITLGACVVFNLPQQTWWNTLRGLVYYCIYIVQFIMYGRHPQSKKKPEEL